MEIETKHEPDRVTYALRGRLDAHQVPRLKERVEPVTRATLLDLTHVNFIDSTALAALINLFKKAREAGVHFSLRGIQDPVRVILEITGLYAILPIEGAE